MKTDRIFKVLSDKAEALGAYKSAVIAVADIVPDRAMPSLEAYGINVSLLAKTSGMKYINGANTVTYFGAVLFNADGE